MKPVRCIIVDDEQPAREQILRFLKDDESMEVEEVCKDGFEAVKSIQKHQPDVVFLDIQMPKLNGFEMLEVIDDPPLVVFSTAYDAYALKAFEVHAVDYLLKPYTRKRFNKALELVLEKLNNNTTNPNMGEVADSYHRVAGPASRVVVRQGGNIIILPLDEIRFFEAMDDYVAIHTAEQRYLKQKPMRFFENNLNPRRFVRVHRSYLVNLDYASRLEPYGKETWKLILSDNTRINVSRAGMRKLNEMMDFGA